MTGSSSPRNRGQIPRLEVETGRGGTSEPTKVRLGHCDSSLSRCSLSHATHAVFTRDPCVEATVAPESWRVKVFPEQRSAHPSNRARARAALPAHLIVTRMGAP